MEKLRVNTDEMSSSITSWIPQPEPAISSISNCCCEFNYEKEKRMNNNEFLKIKKEQELDKIDKEYQLEKKEILKRDPIQIKIHKLQEEINAIFEEEKTIYAADLSGIGYRTKETDEKILELKRKQEDKEDKIVDKYREIEALVADIPAKDRIEIYKMYNIM